MRGLVLIALLAVLGFGQMPWRPCCLLAGSSASPSGCALCCASPSGCALCCASPDTGLALCCAAAIDEQRQVVCTCDRRVPVAVTAPAPRCEDPMGMAPAPYPSAENHLLRLLRLPHRLIGAVVARAGPTPPSLIAVALPIWLRDRHLLI